MMLRQARKSKLLPGAMSFALTVVIAFCAAFCISFPSQAATSPVPKDWECVFDAAYYASNNPDVAAAFGSNDSKLFRHFTRYGMKEGRRASEEFDVQYYKASYADLAAAFGDNLPLYYEHYIHFGKAEGRIASASGTMPTAGTSIGAGAVPGGASSAVAPSQAATLPLYIQRTATLLECTYQSYLQTTAAHYAIPVMPAGAIFVTENKCGDSDFSDYWQDFVYENDLYTARSTYDTKRNWYISTFQPEMTYEDIAEEHGLSLPYVTHTFTTEEIELVKSMLTSPVLLQKTYTSPWDHVFSDGGKYDSFTRYFIYGYYKGMPIQILLVDSFARYSPDCKYLPGISIYYNSSFEDGMEENISWIEKNYKVTRQ